MQGPRGWKSLAHPRVWIKARNTGVFDQADARTRLVGDKLFACALNGHDSASLLPCLPSKHTTLPLPVCTGCVSSHWTQGSLFLGGFCWESDWRVCWSHHNRITLLSYYKLPGFCQCCVFVLVAQKFVAQKEISKRTVTRPLIQFQASFLLYKEMTGNKRILIRIAVELQRKFVSDAVLCSLLGVANQSATTLNRGTNDGGAEHVCENEHGTVELTHAPSEKLEFCYKAFISFTVKKCNSKLKSKHFRRSQSCTIDYVSEKEAQR